MTKYLLPDPAQKLYFLSERISQDPLENYFGQQRARGGRNENPNLQQCVHNATALRVQKSMALEPVRGNCSRKRRLLCDKQPKIDNTLYLSVDELEISDDIEMSVISDMK